MPKFRLTYEKMFSGDFENEAEAIRVLSFRAKQDGFPEGLLRQPSGLDDPNEPNAYATIDLNKPIYVEVANHKIEVFPRAFAERSSFNVDQLDHHNGTATFTAEGAHEFHPTAEYPIPIDSAITIAVKNVECYRDADGDDVCDHDGFFFISGDFHYPLPFELEEVYGDDIIQLLKNEYRENR